MYKKEKIAVVVPCHNEEKLISKVIETLPDFVDEVIIVDDASVDKTKTKVGELSKINKKLKLVSHTKNLGVGASIISGYKEALAGKASVIAVMAGDAQMDPAELKDVISPVVSRKADYVKGNRLFTGEAWQKIPHVRYIGNAFLSLLTKIASGYWHIADSQCGYTAISRKVLTRLNMDKIYQKYGFPNDILVHLNVSNARVSDVEVTPIYGVGEKSGIRLWVVIPKISWLLLRRFFWRLGAKYVIRDFHPLIFFYFMGIILFFPGLILGLYETYQRVINGVNIPAATATLVALLIILGLQSLFFAMWFDMEYNRELNVNKNL